MPRTVSIGAQDFATIRENGDFFVDKSDFIRQWWDSHDSVTLICRPRRFGKTLTMSMVECFFSGAYEDRADLFEGLQVWDGPAIRAEQGAWPVVSLSFADVKGEDAREMREGICMQIAQACRMALAQAGEQDLTPDERGFLGSLGPRMSNAEAKRSLRTLCELLRRRHGKRAIVLLDEYDTPLQEAWLAGYWDEAVPFVRGLFNATFKTNPFLERGLITGITRVAEESIFSDMNNPQVVTATSNKYADCFGFTEDEVFAAMDEFGLTEKGEVKRWYDGFTFGEASDIYNPWSITKYLDSGGTLDTYWVDTSGNGLVSRLLRQGDPSMKQDFERLLAGTPIEKPLVEQVAFKDIGRDSGSIWPLLLATGYIKIAHSTLDAASGENISRFEITNFETRQMFDRLIRRWFGSSDSATSPFVRALLAGDLRAMNRYMNDVALDTFSSFDAANHPAQGEPERFYHGFVLGLLVELRGRYEVLSNRESGYGRYDVMLAPLDPSRDDGVVIEFKVADPQAGEGDLADTVAAARAQIAERGYAAQLLARGVPAGRVREYGFAFRGKRVLIG